MMRIWRRLFDRVQDFHSFVFPFAFILVHQSTFGSLLRYAFGPVSGSTVHVVLWAFFFFIFVYGAFVVVLVLLSLFLAFVSRVP